VQGFSAGCHQYATTPAGRAGGPEEAAAVAVFLASTEAAYVTGQVFVVDGGNVIQEPHGIDRYGGASSAAPATSSA